MIRLSKKFIRRAITGLALLAPVVYLFGSQFFALAGAHGEEVLAETVETTPSYDELMQVENFNYGAFNWTNEHGTRLGFSLGLLDLSTTSGENQIVGSYHGVAFSSENYDSVNFGLGFVSEWGSDYISLVSSDSLRVDEYVMESSGSCYFCFYFVPNSRDGFRDLYSFVYYIEPDFVTSSLYCSFWNVQTSSYGDWQLLLEDEDSYTLDDRTRWFVYFDDGAHLPDGVTWNDELRSYFVPSVKPVESTNYKTSLFSNMFGKSNFLTSWGEDAISDNPHGFAPFGNMLQFVDENMLHLSDLQIGLMGYGYFYYCAHVLLFVCFFDITTFFLSWILRITHKFGGADYED